MKYTRLIFTALLLPFLAGCGGSALAALGIGSLFSGAGAAATTSTLALGPTAATIGETAVIVNPEPATLMLMGGGLVSMAYLKSRKK